MPCAPTPYTPLTQARLLHYFPPSTGGSSRDGTSSGRTYFPLIQ
jgi:hypothetical protein